MKIRCACNHWIREEDEIVIDYLKSVDEMPTPEAIAQKVRLPVRKVCHTLRMLGQQSRIIEGRRRMFPEE